MKLNYDKVDYESYKKLEEENHRLGKRIIQLQNEIQKLKREEEVSNSFDYDKLEKILEKALRECKPVCPGIQYVPYEPSKTNSPSWPHEIPSYPTYPFIYYSTNSKRG